MAQIWIKQTNNIPKELVIMKNGVWAMEGFSRTITGNTSFTQKASGSYSARGNNGVQAVAYAQTGTSTTSYATVNGYFNLVNNSKYTWAKIQKYYTKTKLRFTYYAHGDGLAASGNYCGKCLTKTNLGTIIDKFIYAREGGTWQNTVEQEYNGLFTQAHCLSEAQSKATTSKEKNETRIDLLDITFLK